MRKGQDVRERVETVLIGPAYSPAQSVLRRVIKKGTKYSSLQMYI